MSTPSCSDVCEITHEKLLSLGVVIDGENEDHTDIIDALTETIFVGREPLCRLLNACRIMLNNMNQTGLAKLNETGTPFSTFAFMLETASKEVEEQALRQTSDLDTNISFCHQCGKKVCFERHAKDLPHEYEVCNCCDDHVCDDCVDWKYMNEIDTETPICKQCSALKKNPDKQ